MDTLKEVGRQAARKAWPGDGVFGRGSFNGVVDAVILAALREVERLEINRTPDQTALEMLERLIAALSPPSEPPQTPEPGCEVCGKEVFQSAQKRCSAHWAWPLAPAVEPEPTVTWEDAKRLTVALNLCLSALERHDNWCGHRKGSPGDSIYRRASKAARAALWPSAVEPPSVEAAPLPTIEEMSGLIKPGFNVREEMEHLRGPALPLAPTPPETA